MSGWGNFFVAEAGASAALAGLIFVGVSLNLTKIPAFPVLPNRALQALIFLVTILIVSSLLPVPEQSLTAVGSEILVVGVFLWIVTMKLDINALRKTVPEFKRVTKENIALNQVTVLPYIFAGIAIFIWGQAGVYVVVAAILFSFIKAIADSWVLLVEINR